MKTLVKEGKSIILITHKLDEIRAVADRVTVIRRGKSIQTVGIEVLPIKIGRNDGWALSFFRNRKRRSTA